MWDKAESALMAALKASGRPWTLCKGEGAFYGPKLEYVLRDAIGRDWQCGTVQVDLNLPGRLGAFYIDEHSNKVTPVMLHRAMFGLLERFTGILIEHYAGHLPLWLSPVQAVHHYLGRRRLRARGDRSGTKTWAARRRRPPQREDKLQGAGALPRQGPCPARCRQKGSRRRYGLDPAAGQGRPASHVAGRSAHGSRRGSGAARCPAYEGSGIRFNARLQCAPAPEHPRCRAAPQASGGNARTSG